MNINQTLFLLLIQLACTPQADHQSAPIVLDLWYQDEQQFGTPGLAQQWINILGNVYSPNGIRQFTYQLNEGTVKTLTLGTDLHRLAAEGDFNIDIDSDFCNEGLNKLYLQVDDAAGNKLDREVALQVTKNQNWPLPYTIEWSAVSNIQQVVQVVDGHWEITEDGIRNRDRYYDRVLAFGDHNWQDYEVATTVVFHDFTPPTGGPPTYNVSHAAIASRWPGHDVDSLQPHRKWFPLGATAEFRLTKDLESCRWRIFDGPKPGFERFYVEQPIEEYRPIELGKKYGMKHRVETLAPGKTRYSVKLWLYDQAEPEHWDLVGIKEHENLVSGSALLIAHNTSVTFGDVQVIAIDN